MIAPDLLSEIRQLSPVEKQELFDWLVDDLAGDPKWQDLVCSRTIKMRPPIRVSDAAIAVFEQFEEEARRSG